MTRPPLEEPSWDGDHIGGRPVAPCQECGALWYVTDVRYEGEAALGGPNFSYQKDEQVNALPLHLELLAAAEKLAKADATPEDEKPELKVAIAFAELQAILSKIREARDV